MTVRRPVNRMHIRTAAAVLFSVAVLAAAVAAAATSMPAAGDPFPDIRCATPPEAAHRAYLGIGDEPAFALSDIRADLVIVEIFSMYCPFCQNEAPVVNQMYQAIENDPSIRRRVKILGIGAGNSAFEVNYFRKTYNVAFPLVPDGDFAIHKQIGQVRTPTFFALRLRPGEPARVVHVHSGRLPDYRRFLQTAMQKAGLSE